jgi:hypothetical protein
LNILLRIIQTLFFGRVVVRNLRPIGAGKLADPSLLLLFCRSFISLLDYCLVLRDKFIDLSFECGTSLSSTRGVPNPTDFALPLLLLTFLRVKILIKKKNCRLNMKLLFLLVMQPTNQYPSQHW